jgi:hypothetical protein
MQEGIPRMMSKNFENHSFILIYASSANDTSELMFSNDFDNTLIEGGLNLMKRRSKWFSGIFGKSGKPTTLK